MGVRIDRQLKVGGLMVSILNYEPCFIQKEDKSLYIVNWRYGIWILEPHRDFDIRLSKRVGYL